MGRRLWAYRQVLQDILRRPRISQALDAREVVDMCLRLIGIGSVAGLAYLVQGFIPGARNLYPWAFPAIMAIVAFSLLAFHVAADYRLQLERPKLFDVVCQTTWLGLPINRLDDGSYRASVVGLGFAPILIAHRGELTNVTRLTATPEVRFVRMDNQGWETTNAIQVMPSPSNPLTGPLAMDFKWDTANPRQWVLTGLPLAMARDELLQLPLIMVSVVDGNAAGAHFEQGETCVLTIRLAIRTDKGSPVLPDQVISLSRSDIKNHLARLGIHPETTDEPKQ